MSTKLYRKIIMGLLLLAAVVFLIVTALTGDQQLLIAILCVLVTSVLFVQELKKK